MEIKNVKTIEVAVPPNNRVGSYSACLIEVETDEGIVGVGEARSSNIPAGVISLIVEKSLKPLLVSGDPFAVEALFNKMYRSTQNFGQCGLTIIAISGVEQALWDIIGKAAKQPVYNLIGGCVQRAR